MKHISVFNLAFQIFLRIMIGSVISLMLSCSVMVFLNNPAGRVVCQIMNFSASFSLVYLIAWQIGNADRNKVKQQVSKEDKTKGIKAGVLAAIPFIIPSLILLLTKFGMLKWNFLALFRVLNPVFMPLYYSVFPPALLISEISLLRITASFLVPFVFAIIAQFGYYFGYRDVIILKKA